MNKSKYSSLSEWKKNDYNAYVAAYKRGLISVICETFGWEETVRFKKNIWNKENCISSSKQSQSRSKWKKKFPHAYTAARKNGWLEECCKHMTRLVKPNNFWNKENCKSDANKYARRGDWANGSPSAYSAAKRNKWIEECCQHMENKISEYTLEICMCDAKKYATIKEWRINSPEIYNKAWRKKWLQECTKHMPHPIIWTKKLCIAEAKKYSSVRDWINNCRSSYTAAWKNGWLNECKKHMKK